MSMDIFLVFFLINYVGITKAQTSSDPISQSSTSDNLHNAINSFTQNIYLQIMQSNNEDNFVFSPLSLHSALAMLYMATSYDSETRHQLGDAIGYITNSELLALTYKDIIDSYANQKSFRYGNQMWISDDLIIDPNYQKIAKKTFMAGVSNLQFNKPESVEIVNNWVREKTNNKIKKLVDIFSPPPEMFLANALYFRERWLNPFQDTGVWGRKLDTEFQTENGPVNTTFMFQGLEVSGIGYDKIKYGNSKQDVEVITLPYKNRDFDMQIILPKKYSILEESMKMETSRDISGSKIDNSLFSKLKNLGKPIRSEVEITMPTFKVKTKMDASEALMNLGARRMFTRGAELGQLTSYQPLRVGNILHSAVVEVTKEGTEGAAATGIPSPNQSLPIVKRIHIDRPFIFIVRDKINQIPVLVGRVKDPTQTSK